MLGLVGVRMFVQHIMFTGQDGAQGTYVVLLCIKCNAVESLLATPYSGSTECSVLPRVLRLVGAAQPPRCRVVLGLAESPNN